MEETTILTAARLEQQQLERRLAAIDAEYAAKKKSTLERLAAVKALRAAYGDAAQPTLVEVITSGLGQIVKIAAEAEVVRENSHKARVLAAAQDILKDGVSRSTAVLLPLIEKRGIQFNAANKAGNLSVILSKDRRFVADRRYGWSLKGESPAVTGLSGATMSDQDEL